MQPEKTPNPKMWRQLGRPAAVSLALAFVSFLLEDYFESHHFPAWTGHLAQHLTIAFVVSCVLTVSLEYNSRKSAHQLFESFLEELKSYRRNVAEDVFGAVVGRVVPDALAEEVEEVLRSRTIKSDCEYTISFLPPYPGMPEGYCVVRRDLSFRVENLLQEEAEFPITSRYASDEDLKAAAWNQRPFHLQLEIDDQAVDLEENSVADAHGRLLLNYLVRLGPRGEAKVFLRGEEPVRIVSGRSYYIQSTPSDGIRVSIQNFYPSAIGDIEVHVFHPGRAQVVHDRNLGRYTLNRAFLPGQGFEVQWKNPSPDPRPDPSRV